MTDNRKLEAAIAAGLAADNKIIESLWVKDSEVDQDLLQVSADGATAFAAYRDRFHALEADNERTNRDRSALCIDFALLTEENARLRAFVKDCTTAVIYVDGQAIRLIDGDIGKRAAAVLAESEGK